MGGSESGSNMIMIGNTVTQTRIFSHWIIYMPNLGEYFSMKCLALEV